MKIVPPINPNNILLDAVSKPLICSINITAMRIYRTSLKKTPRSNEIAALKPFVILVSSKIKKTGPTRILNKNPILKA